jgi:alpha-tubulin suppressor-like RCC1 family protein
VSIRLSRSPAVGAIGLPLARWVAGGYVACLLVACSHPPLSGQHPTDAAIDRAMPSDAPGSESEVSRDAETGDADAVLMDGDSEVESRDGSASDSNVVDGRGDLRDGEGGDLRGRYRAIAVVTGETHTCALLEDHLVKCWGNNGYGQLGYGDVRTRGGTPEQMGDALPVVDLGTGRTATTIAAGGNATCAICDDGSLKCWGHAALNGQVPANQIGSQPGDMGDNLRPLALDGRKATHVALGKYVACASTDDHSIWCWGSPAGPVKVGLPRAPVKALSATSVGVFALYEDGTVSPILPDGMSPVLTSVHKVVAITGGTNAVTCALLDDGTITSIRENATPSVLDPGGAVTAIGIPAFRSSVCALFADGSVRCPVVGSCTAGRYWCAPNGSIALGEVASAITSNGDGFMCALLAGGGIKCWGEVQGDPTPTAWLGSGVSVLSTTDGVPKYGPWNAVDLGSHS